MSTLLDPQRPKVMTVTEAETIKDRVCGTRPRFGRRQAQLIASRRNGVSGVKVPKWQRMRLLTELRSRKVRERSTTGRVRTSHQGDYGEAVTKLLVDRGTGRECVPVSPPSAGISPGQAYGTPSGARPL